MQNEIETENASERPAMIRAAIAACFKAHEAANVANVKAKLPPDFFYDFDAEKELDDVTAFREIQAAFTAMPKPAAMVAETPDGRTLAPVEPVEGESPWYIATAENKPNPDEPLPQTVAAIVHVEAEQPAQSTDDHGVTGPGQRSQARLDALRQREGDLLAERPALQRAQRNARDAVAEAVRAFLESDPARQTTAQLSAEYRKASQEQRAARMRGESWAVPPERKPRGERAFVDLERAYSQGGNADTFARRTNRYGNTRGAYPKQALGQVNRDPSRGHVPKPVEPPRPTIPALAK